LIQNKLGGLFYWRNMKAKFKPFTRTVKEKTKTSKQEKKTPRKPAPRNAERFGISNLKKEDDGF
jgi:hypothetical protein